MARVTFRYLTGLKRNIILNAQLTWAKKPKGDESESWSDPIPMRSIVAEDGCPAFEAEDELQGSNGQEFQWRVFISTAAKKDICGIMPEIRDRDSNLRVRTFVLRSDGPRKAEYYLTHARRVGAQKHYLDPSKAADPRADPAIRFTVWAPNAKKVNVVMAKTWKLDKPQDGPLGASYNIEKIAGGYIAGRKIDSENFVACYPMHTISDGYWATEPIDPALSSFSAFDHRPYMYEVTCEDGVVRYRTDLHSRCQIGSGKIDPGEQPYVGRIRDLDGTKGCSVVVDPEQDTKEFEERNEHGEGIWPETKWVEAKEFWQDEFRPGRPVPRNVQDLVIYELHLGTLGFDHAGPGTLADAMALLDYLEALGVNAVELLPLEEFGSGGFNWGYSTSHYFAVEYAGGGRDKYKFFIRECHRRGIAVIVDVVYNHYTFSPDRAEEYYDSPYDKNNMYYWYEGDPTDYSHPSAGYCQNGSSGRAPRFHEEAVRQMFISSAAVFVEEFHVDGFRVDLTQAMHRDNHLEGADYHGVADANIAGIKFLREWCRTLRLLNPEVMLIAEDHTGWDQVTNDPDHGGLGFDATWYADFYHNLSGDTRHDGAAWLLKNAGYGDDRPLAMDTFADKLGKSANRTVVYHESHDEAGNSGTERTILTAINRAPPTGNTRHYAEARSRVAAGLSLLSAGTPMFLFGEEVGAACDFVYGRVLEGKIDLVGLSEGVRKPMFQYYSELIRLRLAHAGLRSRNIDVVYCHNDHRLIAFHRWDNHGDDLLVVASLNNHPFDQGYVFYDSRIPDGGWREIFNSDATAYGGDNAGNSSGTLAASRGRFEAVIPAKGLIVFQRL
jgi:1,4-alpha-glucan branching enzyme